MQPPKKGRKGAHSKWFLTGLRWSNDPIGPNILISVGVYGSCFEYKWGKL